MLGGREDVEAEHLVDVHGVAVADLRQVGEDPITSGRHAARLGLLIPPRRPLVMVASASRSPSPARVPATSRASTTVTAWRRPAATSWPRLNAAALRAW